MMRGRGQRFLQILVLEARRHAIYLRSRKAELLRFPPPGGNGMPHFGGDLARLVLVRMRGLISVGTGLRS
jgi:hypothetical protein